MTPQFVCQTCGNFLQQDPSLETIDDQNMKPIGKGVAIRIERLITRSVFSFQRNDVWWPVQWIAAGWCTYRRWSKHHFIVHFQTDGGFVIRKSLGRKRLWVCACSHPSHIFCFFFLLYNVTRSQSSLDSANGFAVVPSDPMHKDHEQKSMREYRNDVNVSESVCSSTLTISLFV